MEIHRKLVRKQDRHSQQDVVVTLRHLAAPDANARVSRAIDILLETAAKNETPKNERSPKTQRRTLLGQASSEEAWPSKMRTIRKGKNKTGSVCENLGGSGEGIH